MDRFEHRGVAGWSLWVRYILFVCCVWQVAVEAQSPTPAPAPAATRDVTPDLKAAQDQCVGVFLQYQLQGLPEKIPPSASTQANQPYSFESSVTLTNVGYQELQLWELSLNFQYKEIIAKANDVLFLEGTIPGFKTTDDTRIVGVTTPNLLTSINTADDLTLISTTFNFTGTEFGLNGSYPFPKNMSLVNDGYSCDVFNDSGVIIPQSDMWMCCSENATEINSTHSEGNFAPRQSGDITMSFDVNPATAGYTARVSILMNDPIGRIDNWNLTWQWTQGEIINTMKGGQVLGGSDQDVCIYGNAAVALPNQDFSQVMSCSPNPVIIDLDQYTSTDSANYIPHCCRNGTLLPDLINPLQSRSDFEITVLKLPPHQVLDDITPPLNWNIGEGYTCQQPLRVSPAEYTPETLHSTSAAASWQVVCNRTIDPNPQAPKKCCVSFSAYYNDSVIPCPSCSCGCSNTPTFPWNGQTCNPNIDALLLPYQAVPLPPSNRTVQAIELAKLDHYKIPDQSTNPPQPLPCPDYCGVNMNWHVYSDYTNGWSARMTLFNWDKQPVVNWSAAIQMPKAMPGYENAYSFNGTLVPDPSEFNNTLFMQGHTGYDNFFLIGKDDYDVPGKLQSIISFDKRKTPGIHVPLITDGYPTKVWFNGEECRLAESVPAGDAWRVLPTFQFLIVIAVTFFLMAGETIRFL